MSGGSYNYIYSKLSAECANCMFDDEMNEMIQDLCEVLHDLEWWQSGDLSEEDYRETLTEFKGKWFKDSKIDRTKSYIDGQIGIIKQKLYELIEE